MAVNSDFAEQNQNFFPHRICFAEGGFFMQPTIVCTAGVAGMIYLNGRFAGEASGERPLFLPVAPSGPVYLEYRPVCGTGQPLARRLVLSNGTPLADSLAEAEGLCCVAWPSGALEIEFTPIETSSEAFMLDGLPCALARGRATVLRMNGLEIELPDGARCPELVRFPGATALVGDIDGGGQYLAALNADLSGQSGLLVAERIDPVEGGMVSAIVSLDDSVGHGRLERWLLDVNGLNRVSSEATWISGGPRWPETPEVTLIAAMEAALAGLPEEVAGYLEPALAATRPLEAVAEVCDLCVPMKYGLPDPRPRAALLKLQNAHLATARPLCCRAEPTGGAQGPWRIVWIGE